MYMLFFSSVVSQRNSCTTRTSSIGYLGVAPSQRALRLSGWEEAESDGPFQKKTLKSGFVRVVILTEDAESDASLKQKTKVLKQIN